MSRNRAREKGIRHTIGMPWLRKRYAEQGGRCAVTDRLFSADAASPFSVSLDRVDSTKGYTADNCRLVCWIVNLAMNRWGEAALCEMAHSLVGHHKRVYA